MRGRDFELSTYFLHQTLVLQILGKDRTERINQEVRQTDALPEHLRKVYIANSVVREAKAFIISKNIQPLQNLILSKRKLDNPIVTLESGFYFRGISEVAKAEKKKLVLPYMTFFTKLSGLGNIRVEGHLDPQHFLVNTAHCRLSGHSKVFMLAQVVDVKHSLITLRPMLIADKSYSDGLFSRTLPDDVYNEVLKVIHIAGRSFEQHLKTYANQDENHLRDFLLTALTTHALGSVTGETFNKRGKTDILLKYDDKNVFVAECKFWSGPKEHSETIDQLFRYLTWNDSKAAIILFVNRKNFSSVKEEAVTTMQNHKCFIRYEGVQDNTWHMFEFHLPGDDKRIIKIAMLLFHLPVE